MPRGMILPATAFRRGFGRIAERTMQSAFPGTGKHAVYLDFDQYTQGKIIRGLSKQMLLTSTNRIVGSGIVGD